MRRNRRMDDRTNARARETETETDAERGKIEEEKQGIGTDANARERGFAHRRNRNRNRNPIIRAGRVVPRIDRVPLARATTAAEGDARSEIIINAKRAGRTRARAMRKRRRYSRTVHDDKGTRGDVRCRAGKLHRRRRVVVGRCSSGRRRCRRRCDDDANEFSIVRRDDGDGDVVGNAVDERCGRG